jgi:phosphopantothenoylcysteine decarboxylase/phosphopantothenate--cysteine ligase
MTPTALRFVGAASFEGIVGAPVLVDEFERDPLRGGFPGDPVPAHDPIGHLQLVANADVFLVAPASANTVAKLAAGIADGMVTTSFLATAGPRAVAPAMNDRMLRDPATQANLQTLRDRGVHVIDPEEGELASRGERGAGRLPEPDKLLAEIERLAGAPAGPWDGLRVLVTAGGTREPIDPVRFVGNRSSGRMGVALAARAASRGAETILIAANVALDTPPGVRRIDVESAAELEDAVRAQFPTAHVLLMAAAVADFRPAAPEQEKLVREGHGELELRLQPTTDVVAAVAATREPGQIVVGFAAEHGGDWLARARSKLERKGLDAVVVNDVSRSEIGFESERNEVTIVEAETTTEVPIAAKEEVADAILDRVVTLRTAEDRSYTSRSDD